MAAGRQFNCPLRPNPRAISEPPLPNQRPAPVLGPCMARAFRALALFLTAWALATWAFLSTATGPALLRLRRPPQNESSSAARARRLPDAAGAPPWPPPAPAGPNRSAAPPPAPLPVYAYVTIVGTARYLDGGLALGHSLRRHSPCRARCTPRFCCALAVFVPRGAPNSTVARLSHVFQAVLPVDNLSALAPSSYWKFSLNKVTSPGSNGGSWVVLVVFLVVLFFSENPHFLPHTRPTSPPSKTKAHATYAKTKRLCHMFPHATYAKLRAALCAGGAPVLGHGAGRAAAGAHGRVPLLRGLQALDGRVQSLPVLPDAVSAGPYAVPETNVLHSGTPPPPVPVPCPCPWKRKVKGR